MKAVILAGGRGTRLQSVVSDVPKPLAPINGKPFLYYLLDSLENNKFTHVTISVGYMADAIIKTCKEYNGNIQIDFAKEEVPLGTGGGIKLSLENYKQDEYIFIFNGDTFLNIDYEKMYEFAEVNNADIVISGKNMKNCERYGFLSIENNKIIGFNSKGISQEGTINGGIYLIKPKILQNFKLEEVFSFEKDFLEVYCTTNELLVFQTDGYFIDIGIPEDYEKACRELETYAK